MIYREAGLPEGGLPPRIDPRTGRAVGSITFTPLFDCLFLPGEINEEIQDKPPLNIKATIMLGWLWRTSSQHGDDFKPTMGSISKMTGLSRSGVHNSLKELEWMGLISFEKAGHKEPYSIMLHWIPPVEEIYWRREVYQALQAGNVPIGSDGRMLEMDHIMRNPKLALEVGAIAERTGCGDRQMVERTRALRAAQTNEESDLLNNVSRNNLETVVKNNVAVAKSDEKLRLSL